ncbi:cupin domain-containing protein [Nocardia sp. CDC159]|uniref:Cupin domain-containing protein n=1 Tax=Nocardia pulmonis TaxID=2951408 RepID=A0A9X2E996_9NOCA|nr:MULTISPECIES: cupin domain-containing protein [Nocardia]MCM6774136.1 cupin domain-containing protein [Nocardia pulmonis]MCM6787023.1 cupin domain-containing protein [Nocardia sp. CDC159]
MPEDSTEQQGESGKGIDRRMVLGGAAVAAAAVGGGLIGAKANSTEPAPLPGEGDMELRLDRAEHLFKLTGAARTSFDGGYLQGANEHTFPILGGQRGSVYFVHLDPGGFREPHWHPTAWELNFVISGRAKWSILGTHPDGTYHNTVFEAEQGDLVFAPQGHLHYFENARADAGLEVLVIFNSSAGEPYDDIGIVASLNAMPRDVLAAAFGVPESAFTAIPTEVKPVVIGRKR